MVMAGVTVEKPTHRYIRGDYREAVSYYLLNVIICVFDLWPIAGCFTFLMNT